MAQPAAVTVLGSGVALGVYVPALLVAQRLARHGVQAAVEVVESLYSDASLEHLERHRDAYHRDFALALMGHRMTRDIRASLDGERVAILLDRWQAEGRRRFVVWSGFWMPVLERYRRQVGSRLSLDLCRIDAEVSATFKVYQDVCDAMADEAREIWLWSWERRLLGYQLPVSDRPPVPWEERRDRLVVHGGGWGIGTYRERARELGGSGLAQDVVIHDPAEAAAGAGGDRWFMVDPAWRAWRSAPCAFPPFGEVASGAGDGTAGAAGTPAGPASARPRFRSREEHHELFDLVRESRAIVSKPGGGTLIDSLAARTPVVLLEPYGYAEQSNARLWEHLGFGVHYERWRRSGWSHELLEELHRNLSRSRDHTLDYPAELAKAVHGGAS
jgi:hypothetical protein